MISMDVFEAGAVERSRTSASEAESQAGAGETPPLTGKENSERRPHPIEQVRAALEEIGKLIEMIECSNRDNLALLPLFSAELKRALAALAMIRAQVLEEAAQVAENQPSAPLKIGAPQTWIKQQIAAAIRALKADALPPSDASA